MEREEEMEEKWEQQLIHNDTEEVEKENGGRGQEKKKGHRKQSGDGCGCKEIKKAICVKRTKDRKRKEKRR